jgi:hypothetical protein
VTDRSELLGRGAELAVLAAAADRAAAGAGQVLLVEGPAGIGKTALADAARAFAARAGLTPLRARGTELERAFGFGVVRQLLEATVHGTAATSVFTGAARQVAALLDVELRHPAAHRDAASRRRRAAIGSRRMARALVGDRPGFGHAARHGRLLGRRRAQLAHRL